MDLTFERFARHQGESWLKFAVESFALEPGHVLIKDPHTDGLDLFFEMFPQANLIILLRDGRDNTASSVKAGMAVRKAARPSKRFRQRINHLLMRDFAAHAHDWAKCAQRVIEFDERFSKTQFADQYLIVRYEDVFRHPRQLSKKLFDFVGVSVDDDILMSTERVEVVGSSYYSPDQKENARKPNWQPTPPTDAFQPIGRWSEWNHIKKALFKRLAGQELIALGYAKDFDW